MPGRPLAASLACAGILPEGRLHDAAEAGDLPTVEALIEEGIERGLPMSAPWRCGDCEGLHHDATAVWCKMQGRLFAPTDATPGS